jgi:polysaccharide pyruvyl transferase WcaK-like protein
MSAGSRRMGRSPDGRNRQIALFGLFGVGNLGNDGSLAAALRAISTHLPGASCRVICGRPDVVATAFGVPTVPMYPLPNLNRVRPSRRLWRLPYLVAVRFPAEVLAWWRVSKALRGVDHMVIPGTGILDDFGMAPRDVPFELLRWCLVARLRRCRVSFVCVGAGPIHHPTTRRFMRAATRLAHDRSYRDTVSRDFMRSIGVDVSDDPVLPDIVFSLDAPASSSHARSEAERPPCIGVGLMAYRGWANLPDAGAEILETYITKMVDLVESLLDGGHRVRLLIGESGDSATAETLERELLDRRPSTASGEVVFERAESMEQLLTHIAQTDAVVATRFHNVVGAIMCCRPVVSIGYEAKFTDLMSAVGLGEYCQHVEEVDVELLQAHLQSVLAQAPELEDHLAEVNRRYRQALDSAFSALFDQEGR